MRSQYYRQRGRVKISRRLVIGLICTMLLFLHSVDKIEAATLQDLFDGDSIITENARFDNWDLISMMRGIDLVRTHGLLATTGSINSAFRVDPADMIGSPGKKRVFKSDITRVPIPGGVWLLSSGLLLLVIIRRKN